MVQLVHRRRARVVSSICLRYSVAVSTRNSNSIRRIRYLMEAQSFVKKSQRLFSFHRFVSFTPFKKYNGAIEDGSVREVSNERNNKPSPSGADGSSLVPN